MAVVLAAMAGTQPYEGVHVYYDVYCLCPPFFVVCGLVRVFSANPTNIPSGAIFSLIRLGPSVSGSAVLADTTIVEAVKNQHGALISLEMEAYGVLSAATLAARPRPIAFSCKSVCDFADEKKDDRWQSYASFTSARSISQFFERYMIELDFA